jgi:hypothetical protein
MDRPAKLMETTGQKEDPKLPELLLSLMSQGQAGFLASLKIPGLEAKDKNN